MILKKKKLHIFTISDVYHYRTLVYQYRTLIYCSHFISY
jgi:hypothetical protein